MEYTCTLLGLILVVSILTNYSKATPDDKIFWSGSDMEPEEEDPPEEVELALDIAWYRENECIILVGDCWLLYKETKPHLSEERRQKICLKRIKGFQVCDFLTEDHAFQGGIEAEERQRALDIEEEDKKMWADERKRLLARRKEEMKSIWLEIKNGTTEAKKGVK